MTLRHILFPALLLAATAVYPHGGGIDGQGGHNDRAAGNYHFHQGLLAGEPLTLGRCRLHPK